MRVRSMCARTRRNNSATVCLLQITEAMRLWKVLRQNERRMGQASSTACPQPVTRREPVSPATPQEGNGFWARGALSGVPGLAGRILAQMQLRRSAGGCFGGKRSYGFAGARAGVAVGVVWVRGRGSRCSTGSPQVLGPWGRRPPWEWVAAAVGCLSRQWQGGWGQGRLPESSDSGCKGSR